MIFSRRSSAALPQQRSFENARFEVGLDDMLCSDWNNKDDMAVYRRKLDGVRRMVEES